MKDYAQFKQINDLLAAGRSEQAREQLRGLQAHIIALHDEVDRLQTRIGNFEAMLSIPRKVVEDDGLVWLETDAGRQGPFCPHCHDAEGSLIRLAARMDGWMCPCCSAKLPAHAPGAETTRVMQFVPAAGEVNAFARQQPAGPRVHKIHTAPQVAAARPRGVRDGRRPAGKNSRGRG